METVKSHTDLKQGRKLVEFLPLESADMGYLWNGTSFCEYPVSNKTIFNRIENIPCWSLAALLEIIPQEIFDGEYIINITEGLTNRLILTYDHRANRDHSYYGLSSSADNLIDACVNMIEKLNERKML